MFGSIVIAANASGAGLCSNEIAATTTYFVPHIKDYCPSPTPCAKFKKEVKMQGSGTLYGNKILTYQGKTVDLGNCETAFGASGKCLMPFISVAADPRYYRMGDVIEMPSLRGKVIPLPNGKTMVHPGYLIVQDKGGAIKGRNRFDIFTGSYDSTDIRNAFGSLGSPEMRMADKNECVARKAFTVVRREGSSYNSIIASIEDAVNGANSSGTMVAQAGSASSGAVQ